MAEKIKVAMITSYFDRNGVTSQVINYATHLDKTKFDVSIIAGEPYDSGYEKLCVSHGIKLLKLPRKQNNPFHYYITIYSYLKNNKFDIVHVHGSSAIIAIELLIASLVKVPARIAHSHNTTCSHLFLHRILKRSLQKILTYSLACGEKAGKWMYGERVYEVIPNAFDTKKFAFNSKNRETVRKLISSECGVIIGHIGKFNDQKNQSYLIRAFEILASKDNTALLLLVGNGPDMDTIKEQAIRTSCSNRIIFWGETDNPSEVYSAMDIFALPSKYEGLPIVLLEAQISGLPCIVSDKVTSEVDFGNIIWASIDDAPNTWADTMQNITIKSDEEREHYLKNHEQQINKYNISTAVKKLENIYINQVEQTRSRNETTIVS